VSLKRLEANGFYRQATLIDAEPLPVFGLVHTCVQLTNLHNGHGT